MTETPGEKNGTMKPLLILTVPFLAREVHIVLGMLCILGAVALGFPLWVGGVLIVVIELPKEFIFDPLVEGTPNGLSAKLWEGVEDFVWWDVGAVMAINLLWLFSSRGTP